MDRDQEAILDEQALYYRARAPEYDQWWRREGRYDRGPEPTRRWREEVAEVEAALASFGPAGDVLELACGTGWWTERLARTARRLTCIDAAPETLAVNRSRLAEAGLPLPDYREADLFRWRPDRRYDAIFFSFWLSHVPEARFEPFWESVAEALAPGGRVFLVDSLAEPSSTARDHRMPEDGVQERLLNDGRAFRIVKLFREPGPLAERLAALGWEPDLHRTETYFLYGSAARRA